MSGTPAASPRSAPHLGLAGWRGGNLAQAVTAGAENTFSYHGGPTRGTNALVVPSVRVKGGAELPTAKARSKATLASHELHSTPVRTEALPHFMGRAPQIGVSTSVPK